MSVIPSNLGRAPDLLISQIAQSGATQRSIELLRVQEQLSTGKRINRPSEDPIAASLVSVLDARGLASEQQLRNMEHGSSALATVDQTLQQASDVLLEAKTIASSQIGVGSDAETRQAQAVVVDSLIKELASLSGARFADLHVLGGERTAREPIEPFLNGFRYLGAGEGLRTELGGGVDAPITIGADEAFGSLSERVRGSVDLNPALTAATRAQDLRGARGEGVALGVIELELDDGGTQTTFTVDLSGAEDVGDITARLESAIRAVDPAALTGGFPNGVTVNAAGEGVAFNLAGGFALDVRDIGDGTTAADLGLTGLTFDNANPTDPAVDLDPKLSEFTTFDDLENGGLPWLAGDVVFSNAGKTGSVTAAGTMSIGEFQRAVAALDLGVRVEISEDERSLDVINEVSGGLMQVEEDGTTTLVATRLGIRSLQGSTKLEDFNAGRGVEIAHGEVDPLTGLPDPARNVDFEIELSDGTVFTVDLEPADMVDVSTMLAKINTEAAAAGLTIGQGAGEFEAALGPGANGIVLFDNLGGGGTTEVRRLNGFAAEDLGLLDATFTPGAPATLRGEDRATVRVDSAFSTLIELRDALENNDERGIAFAGERLDTDITRLAKSRAVVGGRASRLEQAKLREEDAALLDTTIRGGLENVDFGAAASRFSFLQFVQQAAFSAAAQSQGQSLINFLG